MHAIELLREIIENEKKGVFENEGDYKEMIEHDIMLAIKKLEQEQKQKEREIW